MKFKFNFTDKKSAKTHRKPTKTKNPLNNLVYGSLLQNT